MRDSIYPLALTKAMVDWKYGLPLFHELLDEFVRLLPTLSEGRIKMPKFHA
jgi:hypothetical protein